MLMRIISQIIMAIALLATGFALGVPFGKNVGFNIGSEWAIKQADIVAKEAGMYMPVHMENGTFRVKFKQPPGLHQRAWKLADERDLWEGRGHRGNQEEWGYLAARTLDERSSTRNVYLI